MKAACNSALHLVAIQDPGRRILSKSSLAPSKLTRARLHPSSDMKILLSSIVSDIKRICEEKKYNHSCVNKTVINKQGYNYPSLKCPYVYSGFMLNFSTCL